MMHERIGAMDDVENNVCKVQCLPLAHNMLLAHSTSTFCLGEVH
jgi:hypothetical protein